MSVISVYMQKLADASLPEIRDRLAISLSDCVLW